MACKCYGVVGNMVTLISVIICLFVYVNDVVKWVTGLGFPPREKPPLAVPLPLCSARVRPLVAVGLEETGTNQLHSLSRHDNKSSHCAVVSLVQNLLTAVCNVML